MELARVDGPTLDRMRQDAAPWFRRKTAVDPSKVVEALAIVAETAFRVLGLRPRVVQMMGALAMQDGYLIEMATGEGKSLTAAVASVLLAWAGRPLHVLTVNDYLAERDAEEFAAFFKTCGLTVSAVTGGMEPTPRREAYLASVVYTTSTELLADFLRDRIQLGPLADPDRRLIGRIARHPAAEGKGLVQNGIDTVLVDEADSVLIDEAVTPLLIAVPGENLPAIEAAKQAVEIAKGLELGRDYLKDDRFHEIFIKDQGLDKIDAAAAKLPGVWKSEMRRQELVTQALSAREYHRKGEQYVVQDDKVVIVDDFTGRLMPERSWSNGLHQAVEAMENVTVTSPNETLARLSFQRFFRLFRRVCGMTGTGKECIPELWHIYELPVVAIPTNAPSKRKILPDRPFPDERSKVQAIVDDVAAYHALGRPILVGTRRVRQSQELARALDARGIKYNLLNAIEHKEEARIVKEAGQKSAVTIATNMAGRGTDIKLTPETRADGGLHVIVTERNESGRIDRQLIGRCARQGDPGTCQAFVSPDDELMQRYARPAVRELMRRALQARLPGCELISKYAVQRAQDTAQALAYEQRVGVLLMDEWLEEALSFAGKRNMG